MTSDSQPQAERAATQGAVLRRLLRGRNLTRVDAGQAPGMPQNLPQTPARGAAVALGRAAEELYNLPVRALSVTTGAQTLAELPELLPDRALVLVVEDASGALGVVGLCPAALTSLIEMQSIGRVTRAEPRERRATRTDAAICADFVNAMLAELAGELAFLGADAPSRFRYASFVDDPRPLELMLDDLAYRAMRIDLRFGQGGVRDGALILFLPDPSPPSALTHDSRDLPPAAAAPAEGPVPRSLAQAVSAVPLPLNVILCRRPILLRDLRALRPGDVLKLPPDAMSAVRIETAGGQLLHRGKLGTLHGNRAIRIGGARGTEDATSAAAQPTPHRDAAPAFDPGDEDASLFAPAGDGDAQPVSFLTEPPLGDAAHPDPFRGGAAGDRASPD